MKKSRRLLCIILSGIIVLGTMCPMYSVATDGTILGDIDGNGNLSVSDVVEFRRIIMSGDVDMNMNVCDIDGDGKISVSDVVLLRGMIMKDASDLRDVEITPANFPDSVFIEDVKEFDLNNDGWLSEDEIEKVETIDVRALIMLYPGRPITRNTIGTLKGIEYFTSLKSLYCSYNYLEELDVSKNIELTYLDCSNNSLSSLDISNSILLETLICNVNQISELDAINNTLLSFLSCKNNLLTGLDLTNKNKLWYVSCDDKVNIIGWTGEVAQDIVEINQTNFPDEVFIEDVRKFDLNNDGWLSNVEIEKVESIDVETQPIYIPEDKPAPRARISSLKGIEYFSSLKSLSAGHNDLTELDISHNTELLSLDCGNNNLESLNVSQNIKLYSLGCDYNNLTELDVSHNVELKYLFCFDNNLTELDVSNNVKLDTLLCEENDITSLDVSNNPLLSWFTCDDSVTVIGWDK